MPHRKVQRGRSASADLVPPRTAALSASPSCLQQTNAHRLLGSLGKCCSEVLLNDWTEAAKPRAPRCELSVTHDRTISLQAWKCGQRLGASDRCWS